MKVELSFHATNLKNVAGFGKGISDPFCVVTKIPDNEGNVQQLGKTEVVKNNLNPNWAHVFILDDYDPTVETKITVSIYDKVSNNGDNNISMGSTIFEIGSILKSRGGTTSKKIGKTNGIIYVHGRESQGTGVLRMKLRGTKLKNVEGFGVFAKSDPFFELSRKIDSAGGQTWDNIYRSEEIKNCLEPQWQTIVLELSVLCFGLLDNPIKLEVFDYESSGKHTPMGNLITTINELQIKQSRRELLRLKQDNKDVGMIDIVSLSISNNIGNDTTEAVVTQTLQSTTISSSPSSEAAAAATTTTTTAATATAAAATVFVPTTTTTDRDDGQQYQQQQQASSFAVMAREFENNKPIALKNDVRMISGCEDHKTSADVSNVGSYKLPDPAGRAGGACTATLLKVLYENENHVDKTYTYVDVLSAVRQDLKSKGLSQIPQLTSSNPIDVNEEFQLVPDSATGTRRAVLVGINYVGQRGELRGCHNDVLNVYKYIQDFYGFQDDDITILMDDGKHVEPTKSNILDAYRKVVAESQNGDAIFLHYSGHGSRVRDTSGDEDDGYDECLCPLDCHSVGMIIDDQLYDILVRNLAQGVHMVALMDCCHSGTVMDLPYHWKADGTMQDGMQLDSGVDLNEMMQQFGGAALGLFAGLGKGAKRVGKGVGKGAKKVGTGVQKIVPDAIKPNHHSTEAASTSSQPGDSGVFIPPSAPPAAAAASAAAQPGSNDGGGVFIPPSQPSAAGAQPSAPSHIYDPNNQQVPSYGNTHPATANAGVYVPSGQQQTTYIAPEKYDPYAQTTTTTTTTSAPSYGGGGGGQPYNPYGQPQQQQTYTPNSYGTTNVGGTNPAAGGGGGYVPAAQYNPYAQQQQPGTNVVGGTNPAGGGGGYVPAAQYNPYAQQQQPGSNPNSYGTGTGNQQNNNNKSNTPGQYKPYV